MKCEIVTGNMPQLWEDLLSQLHEKEYPSESIRHYREAMGRVDRYMRENQILEYTEAVGETYLATHGGRISSGRQFYMSFYVRRLNDILNKRPYVVVHTRKKQKDLKHFSGVFERFDEMLCKQSISDGTRKLTFGVETRVRLVGKGSKARRIVIPNECADLLRVHFKQAGLFYGDKNRHVFSSQRNEHMTISCVEEVVSKYVNMAKKLHPGLFQQKAYTPHAFRHTIAVDMLACGCSLPAIKAFLGHSSIQSTMIYATVTSDQANKILRERGLPAKLPAPEKEKGDEKTDVIWFLRE